MTQTIKATSFTPLKDNVFVRLLESGNRQTASGIIIPDDDMKEWGIRPRWAQVYAVGPDVDDLQPGEWIYIEHARWTNSFDLELPTGTERLWRVEYPKSVLMASDIDPRSTAAF